MNIIQNDFEKIVQKIHLAKQKANLAVNEILVELYWNIGRYIDEKCSKENWGKSIVLELALYIKTKEPNLKGFSDKNLWRMKQFYEAYKNSEKLSALTREISWTNNLLILSSTKNDEEREFYLRLAINEKYSSRELERQLKSATFERVMLANKKLSAPMRELPQETSNVFKDIYSLEF